MSFLKKTRQPQIDIIGEYTEAMPAWNSAGIVFRLRYGKALLQEAYGAHGEDGLHSLTFNSVPLIRFHGDAYTYMCPTCEKLISAGYGLNSVDNGAIQSLRDALNSPFISLKKSFKALAPLLGLLSSGFYALVDTSLYPTDGDGHFFWELSNEPRRNAATCPRYEDGKWATAWPTYLLPSQSPAHYNPERAEYYRSKPQSRAVAYAMGSLCTLLDGHHKAVAAALEGRTLKTLVIHSVHSLSIPGPSSQHKAKLSIGGHWFALDALGVSLEEAQREMTGHTMSDEETEALLALRNSAFDNYRWPEPLLNTAKQYPDVHALAYMEWAGDLSEARIEAILTHQDNPDEGQMRYICMALFYTDHPRFFDIAFSAGKNDRYARIWHDIFTLLSRKKSAAVEDFFIDYLVYDDGLRPEVTKIADEYLAHNPA